MSARLIAKVVVFRHFYLRNGRAARSNQHVHKYCIALSPERHHGPWHIAVFTGRSSHLPPVTREATTSLITLSLSPSRGRSMGSCRPKTGRERGNARKGPKLDEYCVTSFGPRRPWHLLQWRGSSRLPLVPLRAVQLRSREKPTTGDDMCN